MPHHDILGETERHVASPRLDGGYGATAEPELEDQWLLALTGDRGRLQREPLLQTAAVVDVPLREIASVQRHAVAAGLDPRGRRRRQRERSTDADELEPDGPRRVGRRLSRHQRHTPRRHAAAQAVLAVGSGPQSRLSLGEPVLALAYLLEGRTLPVRLLRTDVRTHDDQRGEDRHTDPDRRPGVRLSPHRDTPPLESGGRQGGHRGTGGATAPVGGCVKLLLQG
jgi:hypothetical protein